MNDCFVVNNLILPRKILIYLLTLFFSTLIFTIEVSAAELSFEETSVNVAIGSTTDLDIILDPEGEKVIGVDLVIVYDPKYIEMVDITNGDLFTTALGKKIDNTNGIVKYGVATSIPSSDGKVSSVTTKGTAAVLRIKSKTETVDTVINFDYKKGETTDSNVAISGGEDVLDGITRTRVTITKSDSSSPTNQVNTTSESSEDSLESGDNSLTISVSGSPREKLDDTNNPKIDESDGEVRGIFDKSKDLIEKGTDQVLDDILGESDKRNGWGTAIAFLLLVLLGVVLGFVIGKAHQSNDKRRVNN